MRILVEIRQGEREINYKITLPKMKFCSCMAGSHISEATEHEHP